MPDPHDMLTRLMVATETRELPRDVAAWLECGISDFLGGGSFDKGLGLKTTGVRAWTNMSRVKRRNHWLTLAADCVCGSEISDWDKAGRLSKVVKRFQTCTWPRICNNPPPTYDKPGNDHLKHFITLAFHAHPGDGYEFPTSQRHIYRLLT